MRTSHLLLGAAVVATAAFGGVQAQTPITADANDVNVLQYALVLERLEAKFYADGQAKWKEPDFLAANYTSLDYAYFNLIRDHEAAHVAFLTSAAVLGTSAKASCNYTLGNTLDTVQSYVATAAVLEGLGVTAYDGAINAITNSGTQQVAATIATVEARHSAYLNKLVGTTPPVNGQGNIDLTGGAGSLDKANTPKDVAAAATPFIVSCPFDIPSILPQVRPGGVNSPSTFDKATTSNPAGMETPGAFYGKNQFDNDNLALNYALVLENLEANFYMTQGAGSRKRQDFVDFFGPKGIDGSAVYDNLALIGGHESAHAAFLTSVINGRAPNTAVPACTYDWSKVVTDIPSMIKTAILLESTGVSAYDGAVNTITDTNLQQAAATIATIEARHTSYLNLIAKLSGISSDANPFPGTDGMGSTDTAILPADVLTAVGNLKVQTCSFTPVAPKIAPAAVATNSSSSSSTGGEGSAAVHGASFALVATLFAAVAAALRM